MKREVIELEAVWYGGGFHFILQEDKTGLVISNFGEDCEPTKVDENKIIIFWKKVEELGVWNWHKNTLIGNKNMNQCLMVVIGNLN